MPIKCADSAHRGNHPTAGFRLKGTPTFIWRRPNGTEGRIDGIPASIDALVSSVGS
jgi:hypothetical protein